MHKDSHQVTRLEVVDTGRRRRWTEAEKLRIVEESFTGSRQASATARRHGISRALLFSWRRAFRESRPGPSGAFAPAIVAPEVGFGAALAASGLACAPDGSHPSGSRAGRMEVVSAGGRRVIVDRDVDVTALIRVVQGLEGLR